MSTNLHLNDHPPAVFDTIGGLSTRTGSRMSGFAALMLLWATPISALAQNDVPSTETPVAVWKFNAADEPGVSKTAAKFLEAGPRPPTYPSFADTNTAMAF